MKYPSRRTLAKLSLSEVIAKLLTIGTVNLGRRRLRVDEPDPMLQNCPTLDQQIARRLECYEGLARHALFAHGVRQFVVNLGLSEIEAQLKAKNMSTIWSARTDSRNDKERALIAALINDDK